MNVYDLYVIEDPGDALHCASTGVFDFEIGGTSCENCGMSIGPLDETFVPCAVMHESVTLEPQAWPICLDCAAPLIFPGAWLGLE